MLNFRFEEDGMTAFILQAPQLRHEICCGGFQPHEQHSELQ